MKKGEVSPDVSSQTLDEIDTEKEKDALKKIEAVLFVSGRFLNLQELITYTDLNPILLRELLYKLEEKYEKSDSALMIVKKSDMWKMDVKQDYSNIVSRLATGSSEFTKAEKETLAIIAYKQPIKQSVVIKIRGNKGYDHIKKFVDLGLIKKKKIGHTNELGLSEEFYDYFNVQERENKDNNPGDKSISNSDPFNVESNEED
jgi:segregation and condensation protein B